MSTSTTGTESASIQPSSEVITTGSRVQNWIMVLLVFVGGFSSLGLEMAASRLLAPYFGTSQFVWANLIGLILLYLTVGYYLGGRLADRYPSHTLIYGMTAIAAIFFAAIPAISRPILEWSLTSFSTYSVGVFYGSLVAVIFLFAIPMVLLGCISPYAIRLRVEEVGKSGRIAGLLYAISTAGSILGTFGAVLVLIPWIGTRYTFVTFSVLLLIVAVIGLIVSGTQRRKQKTDQDGNGGDRPTAPKKFNKGYLSLLLFIPLIASTLGMQGTIKRPSGTGDGGTFITEKESFYNYIQVVRSDNEVQLILNEGLGVHSIYNPNDILTRGPWDYFLVAPYFNNGPYSEKEVQNVCIIGLGAGTIPRAMTSAYGPIDIDGVEIDGEIVRLAEEHFGMDQPNLNVIVQDGRYHIRTTQERYDIIGLDAYQQPYIPFQLTSVEFLHELQDRLTDDGVVVMNVGRTSTDYRLVDAMAENLRTVFPSVYLIDTERFSNTILVATNQKTSIDNFENNIAQITNPILQEVGQHAIWTGDIREEMDQKVHFTDDLAPIEQLIDTIIFSEVEVRQ